jgi:hypothetical protein
MSNGGDSIIKNPFGGFNASLMNDDEIIEYWIHPEKIWDRQAIGVDTTGIIPVVLMGGRGCGKTMLLKYLSNEVQLKDFIRKNGTATGFLKKKDFLGVYLRFDGPSLSGFSDRGIDPMVWETVFKHYLDVVIGERYVSMLIALNDSGALKMPRDIEFRVVREWLKLMNKEGSLKNTQYSFGNLRDVLQAMADEVSQFVNSAALSNNPSFHPSYVIPSGRLISGIPEILSRNINELRGKKIIILLDEYETLLEQQQKVVNTLVKYTKIPVTFRIGTRINGIKTYGTLFPVEFLQEDADYRCILFEDIFSARDSTYRNLLKEIARKRLETVPVFKKKKLTDIEKWLGSFDPVREAVSTVYGKNSPDGDDDLEKHLARKHIKALLHELRRIGIGDAAADSLLRRMIFPSNPLIEMLNLLLLRREIDPEEVTRMFLIYISKDKENPDFSRYRDLYEKNETGLLFQLLSIYRPKKKQYAGFDTFSMLSSGIIRNFLELCYQSFNEALFYEGKEIVSGKIDPVQQTVGSMRRADKFFETIDRIPVHGKEIRALVNSLGTIFRAWQDDTRLREPEITYFCVDEAALDDRTKKVLDMAVQFSILQKRKAMKGKSPEELVPEMYVLNHILAPHFSISYRIRGRIPQFTAEDTSSLIFGDEKVMRDTIKRLARPTMAKLQTTRLTDFEE